MLSLCPTPFPNVYQWHYSPHSRNTTVPSNSSPSRTDNSQYILWCHTGILMTLRTFWSLCQFQKKEIFQTVVSCGKTLTQNDHINAKLIQLGCYDYQSKYTGVACHWLTGHRDHDKITNRKLTSHSHPDGHSKLMWAHPGFLSQSDNWRVEGRTFWQWAGRVVGQAISMEISNNCKTHGGTNGAGRFSTTVKIRHRVTNCKKNPVGILAVSFKYQWDRFRSHNQ